MRDKILTEFMLKALKQDPSLGSYEDWEKAGDYAQEIRFFPHAFRCYQNAFQLKKNELIAGKLNDILDKISNVLEALPPELKPLVEEFRLNNPLDPSKWLEVTNKLLKDYSKATEAGQKAPPLSLLESCRIALAFCAYCSLRSGFDVDEINIVLRDLVPELSDKDLSIFKSNSLILQKNRQEALKVVALGDNVTLGLQKNWSVEAKETFHYLWGHESGAHLSIANCGTSGAGIMDALLYLQRDVLNYKPNLVLMNFGINDAWLGEQAILAYEALTECVINLIKAQGIQVILITPVPHIPEACPADQKPTSVDLKEVAIEEWSKACKRVALRTNTVLADATAEFPVERSKYFANGFNQPNLEGHKLIAKAISKVVHFE